MVVPITFSVLGPRLSTALPGSLFLLAGYPVRHADRATGYRPFEARQINGLRRLRNMNPVTGCSYRSRSGERDD